MSTASETVRLLAEEFETAWRNGSPAEVAAYFDEAARRSDPPLGDDERRELLHALIEIDLEYRWREWRPAGENATPWLLDVYERRSAELFGGDWPDSLIVAEFKIRQRWGDRPTIDQFLVRFPNRSDALRSQLSGLRVEVAESVTELPHIPGFEVRGELGRGGFGVVYQAWDPNLRRFVAIKTLNDAAARSERINARFAQEAEVIARLNHPHIVKIFHVGVQRERPYLVLEYLPDGRLSDRLQRERLAPQAAAELAAKIADGLEAAHRVEVIHRDLKPDNILFDGETPKIVDFGLARFGESKHTLTQEVMGTPAYMAPEQAAGNNRALTPAVDLYALGVILFQMLAGRRPFAGDAKRILHQLLHDPPPGLRSVAPQTPADLAAICDRCLERRPEARFATAAELRDELRRFVAGEKVRTQPRGVVRRAIRWMQYKPLQAAFLALLGVTTAVGIFGGMYFAKFVEADEQRAIAEQERGVAVEAKDQIAGEQEKTRAALVGEQAARQREQMLLERIERLSYLRQVALAKTTWEQDRLPQARELLKQCPEKFRDWEWRYVHGLCYRDGLKFVHPQPVQVAALAPAGDLAATADGSTVRVWSVATGAELFKFDAPAAKSLDFSADGLRLRAFLEPPGRVREWDVSAGKQIADIELKPVDRELFRGITPDGERYLTYYSARPQKYTVRSSATGEAVATILPAAFGGARFIADGKYVLSWGLIDGRTQLFSASDGAEVCSLENRFSGIASAAGNERFVVLGFEEGTISVWDAKSGKEVWTHKEGNQRIRSLAVSDADQAVIGTAAGAVKVFDLRKKKEINAVRAHTQPVLSVAITPDGGRFLSAAADRTAVLTELGAKQEGREFRAHQGWGLRIRYSADGDRLLTSSVDRTVRLWNAKTFAREAEFVEGAAGINAAVLSPDGGTLFAGCVDGLVYRRSLADRSGGTIGPGPNAAAVADLRLLPGRNQLAVAYHNNPSVVWDLKTGAEVTRLREASRFALSPDGERLAVAAGRQIELLQTADWTKAGSWSASTEVEAVAFSPDGKLLATGGDDQRVRLWDATTGKQRAEFTGHFGRVTAVAFLSDTRLVSGGADKTVRVWDVVAGEEALILGHFDSEVDDVAVSPDGTTIAAALHQGLVKSWRSAELVK